MKEKQYLVSEGELKELILARPESNNENTIKVLNGILIKQFISTKKPVEVIADGEVGTLNCYECNEGFMIGGETTFGIFDKLVGKKIKLWIEEE